MRTCLSILLFLLLSLNASGQTAFFWLEGTVHGYEFDPGRGLLKKPKAAVLEGTLPEVQIRILVQDQLIEEVLSDGKGNYSIPLDFNQLYTIIIKKKGYNTNTILLDTRAFPKEIQKGGYRFTGAEFILNSYKAGKDSRLNRSLGRLYFNPAQRLFMIDRDVTPTGLSAHSQTELFTRAVARNNELIQQYKPDANPKRTVKRPSRHTDASEQALLAETANKEITASRKAGRLTISSSLNLGPSIGENATDTRLVANKEQAIEAARRQLALDKLLQQSRLDSLEILKREAEIKAAEQEIIHARLLINTQQDKLLSQRNSMMLLTGLLVLLVGFLYVGYTSYHHKQRNTALLEQKNKQITDSINYAQRIQQTILVSERTLKTYLPDTFVLSLPRDIVSGDFYFFHPHEDGLVVAVADCTGHGIPGAFMSLIGHRLLREIVAENGLSDPAQILNQLDVALQEVLKGEKEGDILKDGMDISVCLIDPKSRTITFAAAMNPAYLMHGSELHVLQADIISIGGKVYRNERNRTFTNKAMAYASGDMLFLFTDGFMDQFGEAIDQKFNTRRFKEMLAEVEPMAAQEQKEKALETLQSWKGNNTQTDDIMLMGIRLR